MDGSSLESRGLHPLSTHPPNTHIPTGICGYLCLRSTHPLTWMGMGGYPPNPNTQYPPTSLGGEWLSVFLAFSYQIKPSGSKIVKNIANGANMTVAKFEICRFAMLGSRQLLRATKRPGAQGDWAALGTRNLGLIYVGIGMKQTPTPTPNTH